MKLAHTHSLFTCLIFLGLALGACDNEKLLFSGGAEWGSPRGGSAPGSVPLGGSCDMGLEARRACPVAGGRLLRGTPLHLCLYSPCSNRSDGKNRRADFFWGLVPPADS
ncbi:MAG: hypothetical protein U1F66_04460 [bacterium]